MTYNLSVRFMGGDDLDGVRRVLDTTGLFPAAMLDEMAEPFLSGAAPHVWLVATSKNSVIGFAYCEPERMTDGTYNLLAIAVAAERQRGGVGEALVRYLEGVLRASNARLLLVETSTDSDQEGARSFYLKDVSSKRRVFVTFTLRGKRRSCSGNSCNFLIMRRILRAIPCEVQLRSASSCQPGGRPQRRLEQGSSKRVRRAVLQKSLTPF